MSDSPLALAILGSLWRQARSGYDLLRVFSETALGGFSSSPGAIYPALKRMQRHGLVKGEVENRDTLRPRQVYRLTAAGIEAFKQALRQPVTRDEVMRQEDAILLRFVLAGEVLGRDEALRILEEFSREVESYGRELNTQLAAHKETGSVYGEYALQQGIDVYRAHARWARTIIARLKRPAAPRRTGRPAAARRGHKTPGNGGRRS